MSITQIVATGVGSMPGTNPRAAADIIVGELATPHVPELPARGIGADMIGRAAAFLVDIGLDTDIRGYRIGGRGEQVGRRARNFLADDLDALEEALDANGVQPDWVKTQVCGPFTLAASVELMRGHHAITDAGAWRDITASLAEGIANHVVAARRRYGANIIVQLDEPMITRVIAGTLTPLTRFSPIAPIAVQTVAESVHSIVDAVDAPVVLHDCSNSFSFELAVAAHVSGVSLDMRSYLDGSASTERIDALAEYLDAGTLLFAGAINGDLRRQPAAVASDVMSCADTVGMAHSTFVRQVAITPACGLAESAQPQRALADATAVAAAMTVE